MPSVLMLDFEDRVNEVELFFQLLVSAENEELCIQAGVGPQQLPIGTPIPGDWSKMIKGAAYLVLYNLVEAFVRRGFQLLFEAIAVEGLNGAKLSLELRTQWIMQANRSVKTFDGSPKVYMGITNQLVNEIVTNETARLSRSKLPFSGNLDAETIRFVCQQHGVDSRTDPAASGGAALTTVMKKRNALAHGDQAFVECGGEVTAGDLVRMKDETILFLRGILKNIESFVRDGKYKAIP
ncbi:MAG: hypothetical protein JNM43_06200 [Planctomycetaceae bacterium]|nr:hypothetical protein [Planctomycetaceae bacterium]